MSITLQMRTAALSIYPDLFICTIGVGTRESGGGGGGGGGRTP